MKGLSVAMAASDTNKRSFFVKAWDPSRYDLHNTTPGRKLISNMIANRGIEILRRALHTHSSNLMELTNHLSGFKHARNGKQNYGNHVPAI